MLHASIVHVAIYCTCCMHLKAERFHCESGVSLKSKSQSLRLEIYKKCEKVRPRQMGRFFPLSELAKLIKRRCNTKKSNQSGAMGPGMTSE